MPIFNYIKTLIKYLVITDILLLKKLFFLLFITDLLNSRILFKKTETKTKFFKNFPLFGF